MQKSNLEWARYYLGKGYSVIPLKGKIPDADVLPQKNDEKGILKPTWKPFQQRRPGQEELQKWFGSGSKRNIGIVTGCISGLAVADLDTKEAVQIAKDLNFPTTPLVKTAKGFHAYYKYKDGIRNFQKRSDLPGIDLRGDGGYVCAPPSIHETGIQYSWVKSRGLDDIPLAEFPEIILAKTSNDKKPLKELYKGTTEGNRNDTLTRLTGSWVNDGLSFEECIENAKIWNSKNNPLLPVREVEQTVKSIFNKHQKERPATMVLTRLDSLFKEPEETTAWLVDGLLPSGGFSVMVAKPKVGKSTNARTLALHIASGKSFLGRDVNQGVVIYLALEEKRSEVKKHFQDMGANGNEEIHIYTGGTPTDAIKQIRHAVESLKPSLLIIDPLFRLTKVKDGNDYIQVTNALDPLLRIARELKTHVLCVHHSPKGQRDGGDSVLGSQAIFGSVDTLLIMKRHEGYRTIQSIQRYGEDLPETILNYDKNTRTVTIGNAREVEDLARVRQEVLTFLGSQNEPATEPLIVKETEGNTALKRKAIRELVSSGEVKRDGKGGRGDPFKYSRILVPDINVKQEYENQKPTGNPHGCEPYSRTDNFQKTDSRTEDFTGGGNKKNEIITIEDFEVVEVTE